MSTRQARTIGVGQISMAFSTRGDVSGDDLHPLIAHLNGAHAVGRVTHLKETKDNRQTHRKAASVIHYSKQIPVACWRSCQQ